ncbi:MAG: hypothetical protein V7629_15780 [Motiliproteus sp.]
MTSPLASDLKPGVRAVFCVQRSLKLAPTSSALLLQRPGVLTALARQAEALLGFNRCGQRRDRLWFEYDAGHLQLDALLVLAAQAGLDPAASRWTRMRLGWYHYQDANIRDNARNTDSTCCSQSPLRHR